MSNLHLSLKRRVDVRGSLDDFRGNTHNFIISGVKIVISYKM